MNEPTRTWATWLNEQVPRPDRMRLFWATAWFFCLLLGYYQLRPLREAKGFARGSDEIPWLFLASFLAMLVAVPVYGWVVSRGGGLVLVRRIYRFFMINLLLFFAAMQVQDAEIAAWVGRVYFVWLSVFNQFVVSMMWSVFTDAYRTGQAKRFFGWISAGGTLGGIVGSVTAGFLSRHLPVSFVLLVGVVFLELCLVCGRRFLQAGMASTQRNVAQLDAAHGASDRGLGEAVSAANSADAADAATPTPGWTSGITSILSSPYLMGICLFLLAIKACATTVYCQQGDFIRAAGLTETQRFTLLANINTAVLVISLVVQLFGTAALLRRRSMAWVLAVFPAIYLVGFGLLATVPTLWVVVGLVVIHRAASYAVIAPAVEVLYTVIDRPTLYRVKGILDTAVIRGGDVIAAQVYGGLRLLEMGLPAIAGLFLPVAAVTCSVGWWVGQRQSHEKRSGAPANRT